MAGGVPLESLCDENAWPPAFVLPEFQCGTWQRQTAPQEQTLILRNLPGCTHDMLLESLGPYANCIDYVYVPTVFETWASVGYAFVNFPDADVAQRFAQQWGYGPVVRARVQGRDANVKRLQSSKVLAQLHESCKPRLYHQGQQLPFPQSTRTAKPPTRGRWSMRHQQ